MNELSCLLEGILFASGEPVYEEKLRQVLGIDAERVDRKRLMGTMGQTLEQILTQLVPNLTDKETFLKVLDANETAMMPVLGGKLYPGVLDTLRQLGQKIPLFQTVNHTLPKFFFCCLCMFCQPVRLLDHHQRVLPCRQFLQSLDKPAKMMVGV